MKVRNKVLYDFLSYYYGKVKVMNQGNAFRYCVRYEHGIKKIERIEGGEQYAVCCPHCKDKRYRLSVGHVFGSTIDDVTIWHTAFCWNCQCEDIVPQMRQQYLDFQTFYDGASITTAGVAGITGERLDNVSLTDIADSAANSIVKFEGMVPLSQLPADHVAKQYMRSRNFDPDELFPYTSLCYMYNEKREARFPHRRLVIPMFFYGKLVAWQARVITGHTVLTAAPAKKSKWPYMEPKYWTAAGSKRGFFLYNYDIARTLPFCVIAEGAFDVWSIGPHGVGVWGRILTRRQAELIASTWPQAVLFGDPGFEEDWQENQRVLNDAYKSTLHTKLYVPTDTDAGELGNDGVWKRLADLGVHPAVATWSKLAGCKAG
jgi:hypothetical protein